MSDRDLVQVGLSVEAHDYVVQQKELGNIRSLVDAYNIGAAYAIRLGIEPPLLPTDTKRKKNMYNQSTISDLIKVVEALEIVPEGSSPARYAERLADCGIRELMKISGSTGLDFTRIARSLTQS